MHAILNKDNDTYHLDWNNNSLTDNPPLVYEDNPKKPWSIFDILFDIARISNITLVRCNNPTLKDNLLAAYKEYMDNPYNYGFGFDRLQFIIDDRIECFEMGNVLVSNCIVRNIG